MISENASVQSEGMPW